MKRKLILPLLPLGNFASAHHLVGLWPLLTLNDIELDIISFFQAFVAVKLNCAVVYEYVWSIIAANKSVAFCVVEPLHFAFVSCHEP